MQFVIRKLLPGLSSLSLVLAMLGVVVTGSAE